VSDSIKQYVSVVKQFCKLAKVNCFHGKLGVTTKQYCYHFFWKIQFNHPCGVMQCKFPQTDWKYWFALPTRWNLDEIFKLPEWLQSCQTRQNFYDL